jgi:hypothetical protein
MEFHSSGEDLPLMDFGFNEAAAPYVQNRRKIFSHEISRVPRAFASHKRLKHASDPDHSASIAARKVDPFIEQPFDDAYGQEIAKIGLAAVIQFNHAHFVSIISHFIMQ